MAKQSKDALHWADATAKRIVRQRGERDRYVLAAGITPSGTVHFGNMREIITPELVARALRRAGYGVRFIYLWDDYDRFRKVPANLAGDGWERRLLVQVAAERMASKANLAYAPPAAADAPEERREWVRQMRANPKLYRDIVTRAEKLADNIVRRTLEHPEFDRKPDRYEPPPDRSGGAAADRGRDAARDRGEGLER